MALDPIVSLSVAIAEGPGSYAAFLGSGVSVDAGVLTGSAVMWKAVAELRRMTDEDAEPVDQGGLAEWLAASEHAGLDYSGILELIAPDAATRRDYLSGMFEGKAPGPTHEHLAELAARGLIRVFVTTNFDRLLEDALRGRGIEPIVITSGQDLARAPAREHAHCYVLKPHGDYLQQTIRNTAAELAELDDEIAVELQEVFDRYGIIVLGYSGSDPAIARALRARNARYGLYWVQRGPSAPDAASLIEAIQGRIIRREGAAEFLHDLDRRIARFEEHPTGRTPVDTNDELVALLRAQDEVGARELLRHAQHDFAQCVHAITTDQRVHTTLDEHAATALLQELRAPLEQRLASLLPLLLHRPDWLQGEARQLADFTIHRRDPGATGLWKDVPTYCVRWLGWTLGSYAAQQWALSPMKPFLTNPLADRYGRTRPLVPELPDEIASLAGKLLNRRDQTDFKAPWFNAHLEQLAALPLLDARYPEFVRDHDTLLSSMVAFDFVLGISMAEQEERAFTVWTLYDEEAERFAARLHSDAILRSDVAEAVGMSLDSFDEKAPGHLRSLRHIHGMFNRLEAISILETGRPE